eukprot:5647-Chlamydomonas_euryale.AAC.6
MRRSTLQHHASATRHASNGSHSSDAEPTHVHANTARLITDGSKQDNGTCTRPRSSEKHAPDSDVHAGELASSAAAVR